MPKSVPLVGCAIFYSNLDWSLLYIYILDGKPTLMDIIYHIADFQKNILIVLTAFPLELKNK